MLFADDLVPLISPKLLDGHDPQGLDADAIANLPLLNDSDATGWRHWLAEHGVKYRPKPTDRRFEDYSVGLSAADAGLGVILAVVAAPVAAELAGAAASDWAVAK